MRRRYGRYAVPASAVTATFSIACRKLSKTQLAFPLYPSDYVRSPFPVSSPVPSHAAPRPSIRQTGRDGRNGQREQDAIGQSRRYGNRRPIGDSTELTAGRGAAWHHSR